MSNLRDVRLRMRAIRQTLQVTRAMNLISTAKLRKGRRVLQDIEPFFTRIQKSMIDILSDAGTMQSSFFARKDQNKMHHTAVIVVTSDKGLAGGYNANIFRHVIGLCSKLKNPVLLPVGTIGYRHFLHSPYAIIENFSFKSRLPAMDDAAHVAEYILSQYLCGALDEIHLVYTHMYSSVKLQTVDRQLLPLDYKKFEDEFEAHGEKRVKLHFEYLPSRDEVFHALVPFYIKGIIFGALVEGYVSEQNARMAAMDEASKNAEKMLLGLQISYNRARQAGITQEVSEIIGGAAALNG